RRRGLVLVEVERERRALAGIRAVGVAFRRRRGGGGLKLGDALFESVHAGARGLLIGLERRDLARFRDIAVGSLAQTGHVVRGHAGDLAFVRDLGVGPASVPGPDAFGILLEMRPDQLAHRDDFVVLHEFHVSSFRSRFYAATTFDSARSQMYARRLITLS